MSCRYPDIYIYKYIHPFAATRPPTRMPSRTPTALPTFPGGAHLMHSMPPELLMAPALRHDLTGPPEWSAWAITSHLARTAQRCRVLAGTSAGTGRAVEGTRRCWRAVGGGGVLPMGTPGYSCGTARVLACAAAAARPRGRVCGAVVRRLVRVRCRG